METGKKYRIKFSAGNTASSPKLQIGGVAAKDIKIVNSAGSIATPTTFWNSGEIVEFIYDGTQFLMQPLSSMVDAKASTEFNYSDTETAIGTWFTKTLYQKTINFGALPNNNSKDVTTGLPSTYRVKKIFGYARRSDDGRVVTLPRAHVTDANNMECGIKVVSNTLYISVFTGSDQSSFDESYVTIQYTKS